MLRPWLKAVRFLFISYIYYSNSIRFETFQTFRKVRKWGAARKKVGRWGPTPPPFFWPVFSLCPLFSIRSYNSWNKFCLYNSWNNLCVINLLLISDHQRKERIPHDIITWWTSWRHAVVGWNSDLPKVMVHSSRGNPVQVGQCTYCKFTYQVINTLQVVRKMMYYLFQCFIVHRELDIWQTGEHQSVWKCKAGMQSLNI